MTDREIEGRREDVEDARRRLQEQFGVALAEVMSVGREVATRAEHSEMTLEEIQQAVASLALSDERLSVGEAVLRAEMLDLRKLINYSTLDKRIVDHIDNRVLQRCQDIIEDAVRRLNDLMEYEQNIDQKLRLLDAKIGEFKNLRQKWRKAA